MTSQDGLAAPARPALGRSIGTVGAAILVASVLGYVLLVLCGRLLSPAEYGVFLTFWGVAFGFGSALSPVEQEVSRQSAHARGAGERTPAAAAQVVVVAALLTGVCAAAVLLPGPRHAMFDGSWGLAALVVVAAPAFAGQFGVRGLLIGHDRVRPYGRLLVAEPAVRLVVLALVIVLGAARLTPLAAAVVAGALAWVAFLRVVPPLVRRGVPLEPWMRVGRRVLALVLAAALTASVITGYPAMVRLLGPPGDAAGLGALFAALTVARVPLLLVSPLQALAVPAVVRLSTTDAGPDGGARLRGLVGRGLLLTVAAGVAGAAVGWWLGQPVIRLVYGDRYVVEPWAVAGLVWSSVMLAGVLLLGAVLVARQRYHLVTVTWAVVAVVSAVLLLAWHGDAVTAAVAGLVAGPTCGLVLAAAVVLSLPRDAAVGPLPGGPRP